MLETIVVYWDFLFTMKENFVTYEQALALKELGFDEKVFQSFTLPDMDEFCKHPLKQQVFKFFRDKFNQHSFIELVEDEGIKYDYCLYVDKSPEECIDFGDGPHNTYEEAENACIDKLIQLFK